MTKEFGVFLGSMVGEVIEVDVGVWGDCSGKFLRVRVLLEVDKPLRQCLRVDMMEDGNETIMLVRYERFPIHYYWCRRLGHSLSECVIDPRVGGGEEDLPFGAWLKVAVPPRCM
ncbi:hypothetical protein Dsin_029255 [Dipteronia sinensis]|uniref:Zinc knuckle CX2CX4HX4C domain-containing protein n=1 Tax=Dipteronia sinensis TaxID=43782 RepID=A0AAD9ZSH4_9ROSI|nr:hypothetical protein Dsin_029255 [Dipteronia sinensis]